MMINRNNSRGTRMDPNHRTRMLEFEAIEAKLNPQSSKEYQRELIAATYLCIYQNEGIRRELGWGKHGKWTDEAFTFWVLRPGGP